MLLLFFAITEKEMKGKLHFHLSSVTTAKRILLLHGLFHRDGDSDGHADHRVVAHAPRKPIISTCAGTEEQPANCASECIRPMVSVMP